MLVLLLENRKIPTDLRDEALKLQQQTDWDDAGGQGLFDGSYERSELTCSTF